MSQMDNRNSSAAKRALTDDDHLAVAAVNEVHPQFGEDSVFDVATCDQINSKVFSPLNSQIHPELPYVGSPFANDFGNNHNGMHFQDGTCEQDVPISELLEVLQNLDEYSCKESVSLKISAVGSETHMPGNIPVSPRGLLGNSNIRSRGSYNDSDADMVHQQLQMQKLPMSHQAQASIYGLELGTGDMGGICDYSAGQDASPADSSLNSELLVEPESRLGLVSHKTKRVLRTLWYRA